uniref:Latent transforming growth factor beta binding protein 3 n=1 Tax=Eptatretus burgeri TaxID=7764 RepID=A0A8C4NLB4_EPTBU
MFQPLGERCFLFFFSENLMMPIPKRIKVVFTPTICKLHCSGENCRTNCSKGNVTTIISEDGQTIFPEKGAGFRVFVCGIPCRNGGRCNLRNKCWCPSGFTGKFCHIRMQQSSSQHAEDQPPKHSMYTLPMSQIIQRFPNTLDLVNVHVKHPPEASVQIHQVARMDGGLPMQRQQQLHPTTPRQTGSRRPYPVLGMCPCFEVTVHGCTRPLPMLTHQDVCCGSVGAAWGIDRCTKCPEKHDHPLMMHRQLIRCPHGYRKENATYCTDIDECTLRGVCTKGTCINSAGNYTCVCRKGYVRDAFRHESEKVLSTKNGSCFLALSGDVCRLPVSIQLTKHFCCCSVGKAWGEGCERCPPPSHGMKKTFIIFPIFAFMREIPTMDLRQEIGFEKVFEHQFLKSLQGSLPKLVFSQEPRKCLINFFFFPNFHYFLLDKQKVVELPDVKTILKIWKISFIYLMAYVVMQLELNVSCHSPPPHVLLTVTAKNFCLQNPGACGAGQYNYLFTFWLCVDMDECLQNQQSCSHGQCHNTLGTFYCTCNEGFVPSSNSTACTDVDECENAPCSENGLCNNLPGSYECKCNKGYTPSTHNGQKTYVDECLKNSNLCYNGRCKNIQGSFKCSCNSGFQVSSNEKSCEGQSQSIVCIAAKCTNTAGSFRCNPCEAGFELSSDGRSCEDIDECENETLCGEHQYCINLEGSFECFCDRGFQKTADGKLCVDVDECTYLVDICGEAHCENVEGSFLCLCLNSNEEFDISTSKCIARSFSEDPSEDSRKDCYYNLQDENRCNNVIARNVTLLECCCTVGAGWGSDCTIAICTSLEAELGPLCPNGQGFIPTLHARLDDLLYEDADECTMFQGRLCKNGHCRNTRPGFECLCQPGFDYDSASLQCTDIDECQNPLSCVDAECFNTDGSYVCFCTPPSVLDETKKRCVNRTEHAATTEENSHMNICWMEVSRTSMCSRPVLGLQATYTECCCRYGAAWGLECALCPSKMSDDYAELCNIPSWSGVDHFDTYAVAPFSAHSRPENEPSFLPENFPHFLPDTNPYYQPEGLQAQECGIAHGCENGRCVRVPNGFTCDCYDGYRLDTVRVICMDIDECEEGPQESATCHNAHCLNTDGSYSCVCLPGYVPSQQPNHCMPIVANPHTPHNAH